MSHRWLAGGSLIVANKKRNMLPAFAHCTRLAGYMFQSLIKLTLTLNSLGSCATRLQIEFKLKWHVYWKVMSRTRSRWWNDSKWAVSSVMLADRIAKWWHDRNGAPKVEMFWVASRYEDASWISKQTVQVTNTENKRNKLNLAIWTNSKQLKFD